MDEGIEGWKVFAKLFSPLCSLGVIAYILFCGFPPFYDDNNQALFRSIKRGQYEYPSPFWDDVSESAKNLIDKMLVLNPEERYSAKEVRAK